MVIRKAQMAHYFFKMDKNMWEVLLWEVHLVRCVCESFYRFNNIPNTFVIFFSYSYILCTLTSGKELNFMAIV